MAGQNFSDGNRADYVRIEQSPATGHVRIAAHEYHAQGDGKHNETYGIVDLPLNEAEVMAKCIISTVERIRYRTRTKAIAAAKLALRHCQQNCEAALAGTWETSASGFQAEIDDVKAALDTLREAGL